MQRLIIIGLLLLLSSQSFAKEWTFDVYLDKSKMGTHTYSLNKQSELLSRAKFKVKLLFIDAYSYDHTSKEAWENGCLSTIEATTKENKITTKVAGKQTGNQFEIYNGAKNQILPDCVMTFAYWNPKILTQNQLLNPQNAEYLKTNIKLIGTENIEVQGNNVAASRYQLQGISEDKIKLNIDLWYDQDNNWVALQSTTPEGYKVIYKLRKYIKS
jgi:hypothetical protein